MFSFLGQSFPTSATYNFFQLCVPLILHILTWSDPEQGFKRSGKVRMGFKANQACYL